jgi:Leucine-rich repeat (LRR) protein
MDMDMDMDIQQNKDSLEKLLLEKLSIKGITKGLPNWIEYLSKLAEITLCETSLKDLGILGKLKGLRCLTLRHGSYTYHDLTLKSEEFQHIKFLAIEGASHIRRIIIQTETAPELEKISWTFTSMDITMDTISDLNNLPKLKELEFSGKFDPSYVQLAVARHPNCLNFECKPPRRG